MKFINSILNIIFSKFLSAPILIVVTILSIIITSLTLQEEQFSSSSSDGLITLLINIVLKLMTAYGFQEYSVDFSDSGYLEFLHMLGIQHLKAIEFVNLGDGFATTTHRINYFGTYIPTLYISFRIIVRFIKSRTIQKEIKKDQSKSLKNTTNSKKSISLITILNPINLFILINKIAVFMSYLVPNPNTGMDFKSYLYIITGLMFIMNDRSDYLTTIVGLMFFFIVFICKFNINSKTNLKTA